MPDPGFGFHLLEELFVCIIRKKLSYLPQIYFILTRAQGKWKDNSFVP